MVRGVYDRTAVPVVGLNVHLTVVIEDELVVDMPPSGSGSASCPAVIHAGLCSSPTSLAVAIGIGGGVEGAGYGFWR